MLQENLKQYVLDNSKTVSMQQSTSHPGLYVLKYKKTVFYNDSWNDYLEHCRGSVVDKDFNLLSYPFTKIYNFRVESRAPVLDDDTEVIAFRKVNGFMVSASYHNGDILVSTTGSTDSPYVAMAKEMMLTHMCWADWQLAFNRTDMDNLTVMFECVHPNDPHIIPEVPGMYVLGYRENTWGSKVGHDKDALCLLGEVFNCYVPEFIETTVGNLIEASKNVKHEGFVFYTKDSVSAKIKSPYYLVQKALARKKDIYSLNKKLVEEEYYPLVNHLLEVRDYFNTLSEQDRLEYIRNFLTKNP